MTTASFHRSSVPAVLLTSIVLSGTTLWAGEAYWPKFLQDKLLEHDRAPMEIAPNKITAIYLSAAWCGPCKVFTPELIKFRETHADRFQFIFVSRDHDLKSQLEYIKESGMKAPSVPFDSDLAEEFFKTLGSNGIPMLAVYSPAGKLITTNGRGLIQSGGENADYGNASADGFAAWKTMLDTWRERLSEANKVTAKESNQRLQALKDRHKECRFWPIYERWIDIEQPKASLVEARAQLRAYGAYCGSSGDWADLRQAAEIIRIGEPGSGELHRNFYWMAEEHYGAAGDAAMSASAAARETFLKTMREWLKDKENYLSDYALHALAAAGAHKDGKAARDLFWKSSTMVLDSTLIAIIGPLLGAGDERAFDFLEQNTKDQTLDPLAGQSLRVAIKAGNARAKAYYEKLVRRTPWIADDV